jgi:hypothetical protein
VCCCLPDSRFVWLFAGQSLCVAVCRTVALCGCLSDSRFVWLFVGQSLCVAVCRIVALCGCLSDSRVVWLFVRQSPFVLQAEFTVIMKSLMEFDTMATDIQLLTLRGKWAWLGG